MKRKYIVWAAFLAVSAAAGWMLRAAVRAPEPAMTTPYQAVLLSNGQVYYGRLEGLGTPFPVLREVYYVQSGVKPDTRESANVLLKRGKEWHAPDRMVLNAGQIILVEPVTRDSRVASLIAELSH